jgi:hypothetical protein
MFCNILTRLWKAKFVTTRSWSSPVIKEFQRLWQARPTKWRIYQRTTYWNCFAYTFPELKDSKLPRELKIFHHLILDKCLRLPLAVEAIATSMAAVTMIPHHWNFISLDIQQIINKHRIYLCRSTWIQCSMVLHWPTSWSMYNTSCFAVGRCLWVGKGFAVGRFRWAGKALWNARIISAFSSFWISQGS